jgi:hypothetical protein
LTARRKSRRCRRTATGTAMLTIGGDRARERHLTTTGIDATRRTSTRLAPGQNGGVIVPVRQERRQVDDPARCQAHGAQLKSFQDGQAVRQRAQRRQQGRRDSAAQLKP